MTAMLAIPYLVALLGDALIFGSILLGCAALFAWQYARHGSAAEGSPVILRWTLTVGLIGLFAYTVHRVGPNPVGPSAFLLLIAGMVVSVLMMILWLPTLVAGALGPLTGSLTGGNEKVEAKPAYYRAIALKKRGEFQAAIAAVRMELERFRGDSEGLLMIVDLLAEDLKDPNAALEVLRESLQTPGRSESERAQALSRWADIQLQHLQDAEAARETLEEISREFGESPAGHLARQRLAHLPGAAGGGTAEEPPRLVVKHHEERVGLMEDFGASRVGGEDPAEAAAALNGHLNAHPDDWESRERLALLYAESLNEPSRATAQLERLLSQSGVPARHVARWYQLLVDLQLKATDGVAAARITLERMREQFPDTAWAAQAETRLRHLGLDQKAKEAPKTLKLGQYEQKLGLKTKEPPADSP
ncbi:MAG: hypothetical protein J0L84_08325 [Verrucomicrobia bacterium]|nr:hypothetical protein [Verrucomicrobiota bacterium]